MSIMVLYYHQKQNIPLFFYVVQSNSAWTCHFSPVTTPTFYGGHLTRNSSKSEQSLQRWWLYSIKTSRSLFLWNVWLPVWLCFPCLIISRQSFSSKHWESAKKMLTSFQGSETHHLDSLERDNASLTWSQISVPHKTYGVYSMTITRWKLCTSSYASGDRKKPKLVSYSYNRGVFQPAK